MSLNPLWTVIRRSNAMKKKSRIVLEKATGPPKGREAEDH